MSHNDPVYPAPGTVYVNPSTGAAHHIPVDNSADGLVSHIDTVIAPDVNDYLDESRGLNWRIANYGSLMGESELEAAIDGYRETRGSEWSENLDSLHSELIGDGSTLMQRLGSEETLGLSRADREKVLDRILDEENPEARIAIIAALSGEPPASAETLDRAIEFFAGVDLQGKSPELADALAQARLQRVGDIVAAIDPGDPATLADARAAIDELRGSDYAAMMGLDQQAFAGTLDALAATLPGPNATPEAVDTALSEFADAADALDASAGGEPAAEGLRLLAIQSGAIGLEVTGSGLLDDPVKATQALTTAVRAGPSTAEFLLNRNLIPANGVTTAIANPTVKAILGKAGMALGAIQTLRYLGDGDLTQAGLSALGVGGLALGTFGTASWAGPVGLAIGVIAFGGSLGVNQWRKVEASNEFMDDESQAFLEAAGLDPEIADVLTDQSGEGHSPVPILVQYAELKGYDMAVPEDRDAVIEWLNSISPDTLSRVRDGLHHTLDDVGGDAGQLGEDSTRPPVEYSYINPSTGAVTIRQTVFTPATVGEIDAMLYQIGKWGGGDVLPERT